MRFFLGGLLALSALTMASPAPKPHDLQPQPPLGCSIRSAQDQKVHFLSGMRRSTIFVPADGVPHTIGGVTDPELQCVDESQKDGPCASCDVKVDHIQVMFPGSCEITIKDDKEVVRTFAIGGESEQLFFGTAGHPGRITCWPPQRSALIDRDADTGSLCPVTGGSNITFGYGEVQPHKYVVTVPSTKHVFGTQSPNEELRCSGPIGGKYAMCLPCDLKFSSLQVSQSAGICAITMSEHSEIIYTSYTETPLSLNPSGKVLSVACGLQQGDVPAHSSNKYLSVHRKSSESIDGEIHFAACNKTEGDVLIRTWSNDMEYHSYVTPNARSRRWQHQQTQLGCIPVSTDQGVTPSRCMNCTGHIDSMVAEGPADVLCAARRSGSSGFSAAPLKLTFGHNYTFAKTDNTFFTSIECHCTTGNEVAADSAADSIAITDVTQDQSMITAFDVVRRAEFDSSVCPSLGYNFALKSVNGDLYFPPIPQDSQAHWLANMSCIRLSDLACVPCSQIGSVASVSSKIKFGPCIVFTEDQRSFNVSYVESMPDSSNVGPLTTINPEGVISGIECGHL